MVGYVRRNYMVPIPQAESFEELNQKLLKDCLSYGRHRLQGRDKTVGELFEKEKAHLVSLPEVAFSNIQTTDARVNPYSTVLVDKNHYSVPTRYVGLRVQAVVKVSEIEIYSDRKRIAAHKRAFANNNWQLNPDHYLELLQQRPQPSIWPGRSGNGAKGGLRAWNTFWQSFSKPTGANGRNKRLCLCFDAPARS